MDRKKILLLGIIVVVIAVIAAFTLSSPEEDVQFSKLDVLGNGTIGENGTLYAKLTNGEGIALKDKEVHVSITDSKGKVVFEKTTKTYVNGVANVKVTGVSPGKYEVNVTFAGDENYTESSVSEKLTIAQGVVEEDTTDIVADTATVDDANTDSSVSSSPSYSQPSYSSSSSSSSYDSSDSSDNYYDEDGNAFDPVIDEDGNPVLEE